MEGLVENKLKTNFESVVSEHNRRLRTLVLPIEVFNFLLISTFY